MARVYRSPWEVDEKEEPIKYRGLDRHKQKIVETDFDATIDELNERIAQSDAHFEEIERKIAAMADETQKKIEGDVSIIKEKIEESKARVFETLALFVALFTFLSLQVQIMKDERNINNIVGLVLISGGLITFFVLILDIMVKSKGGSKDHYVFRFFLLLVLCLAFIACGLTVLYFKVFR